MNLRNSLSLAVAALCVGASFTAQSAEPRSTACTLNVQMKQGSVSAPIVRMNYDQSFVIVDGQTYFDDFGTFIRFRDLTVTAVPGVDKGATLKFNLYADVGVFDWIELRTELDVTRDDTAYVSKGSSSYGNTTQGDHFTVWTISCQRVKA